MDQQPTGKKKEIIAALAVLIVIAAIVTAASLSVKKKNADMAASSSTGSTSTEHQTTTDTSTDNTSTTTTPDVASTPSYKDGSYTATGSYSSPGGLESITIDVTLKDGVVTATSAQSGAVDSDGREYQSMFISGYKRLVVGKNIDSISLSRVSGSSLTSQGFNSALEKIKSQAQQNA